MFLYMKLTFAIPVETLQRPDIVFCHIVTRQQRHNRLRNWAATPTRCWTASSFAVGALGPQHRAAEVVDVDYGSGAQQNDDGQT
jgi:hypothetical protein